MEWLIRWWCDLIGITDPVAIQVAVGVSGVAALIIVILIAFAIAAAVIAISDSGRYGR